MRRLILCIATALGILGAVPLAAQGAGQEAALWTAAVGHMRQEQPAEALPHLERLVTLAPGNATYRLELGYALMKLGHFSRARYNVETAWHGDLDANARNGAAAIMAEIDKRQKLTGYFHFALQPETNPSLQTNAESLTLPGGPRLIPDEPERSTSLIVALGATYRIATEGAFSFPVGVDLWARQNETEPRLNDRFLTARAGVAWDLGQGRALGLTVSGGRRINDGRAVSSLRGVSLTGETPLGTRSLATLQLTRNWQLWDTGEEDEVTDRARLWLSHGFGPRVIGRLQLGLVSQTVDGNQLASWDEREIGLGAQIFLPKGFAVDVQATAAQRDYRAYNVQAGVTRADTRHRLEIGVIDRDLRVFGLVPQLRAGVERNRSNIDFTSYDNRFLSLSFTRNF